MGLHSYSFAPEIYQKLIDKLAMPLPNRKSVPMWAFWRMVSWRTHSVLWKVTGCVGEFVAQGFVCSLGFVSGLCRLSQGLGLKV